MSSSVLPPTLTIPLKRSEPLLTPATSVDDASSTVQSASGVREDGEGGEANQKSDEPPKKKRRVALTRVGDLDP